MKIIHTSDWHIGKSVNEFSMIEDQRYILNNLIKLIEEEKPDALVIAGDIYDRSVPPAEAVELLDEVFSKIIMDLKTPILAIAGNHDSSERIAYGSNLFKKTGLHIEGVLKKEIEPVTLNDEYGDVDFYLIPFADPAVVRKLYEDDKIKTYDDAARIIIENINANKRDNVRTVCLFHGYVMGSSEDDMLGEACPTEDGSKPVVEEACPIVNGIQPIVDGDCPPEPRSGIENTENNEDTLIKSDSERPLSIGGSENISAKYFKDFNYTALGHLHAPQRVKYENIRYSGSLLKYSLSECSQKKAVNIVEIDSLGEVNIRKENLGVVRDMRLIRGNIEDLIRPEVYKGTNVSDYVFASLTDEDEIIDPINRLRTVYKNIMGLKREAFESGINIGTASKEVRNKSMYELFEEFYSSVEGKDFDDEKKRIVEEIINEVNKEGK